MQTTHSGDYPRACSRGDRQKRLQRRNGTKHRRQYGVTGRSNPLNIGPYSGTAAIESLDSTGLRLIIWCRHASALPYGSRRSAGLQSRTSSSRRPRRYSPDRPDNDCRARTELVESRSALALGRAPVGLASPIARSWQARRKPVLQREHATAIEPAWLLPPSPSPIVAANFRRNCSNTSLRHRVGVGLRCLVGRCGERNLVQRDGLPIGVFHQAVQRVLATDAGFLVPAERLVGRILVNLVEPHGAGVEA